MQNNNLTKAVTYTVVLKCRFIIVSQQELIKKSLSNVFHLFG